MPRSSVLVTGDPVSGDTVAAAVAAVEGALDGLALTLRVLDDGAALQVLADGVPLLSVLRPRPVPTAAEAARVRPGLALPAAARWWTEAYTPWSREGVIGLAVLDEAASRADGIAHHEGVTMPPEWEDVAGRV